MTSTPLYLISLKIKQNKKHVNRFKFISKSLQILNAKNKTRLSFFVVLSYGKNRRKKMRIRKEKKSENRNTENDVREVSEV